MKKPHIFYLQQTIYPVHIGYTSCKKSYDKELIRLGIIKSPVNEFANYGRTLWYRDDRRGNLIIVTIDKDKVDSPADLMSVISHEATHVCQYIMHAIGEDRPGWETEAYMVGWITREIFKLSESEDKKNAGKKRRAIKSTGANRKTRRRKS